MRRRLGITLVFLFVGLVTTLIVATLLAILVDVDAGVSTQASSYDGDGYLTVSRWDRIGAARIHAARTRGLNWGPEQAAGPPNTPGFGDQVTAWASLTQDAGTEWLILEYDHAVNARELHVYENLAPGAVFRVTSIDDAGNEMEAWAGKDPSAMPQPTTSPGTGVLISKIPLSLESPTRRVKIYLASDKVPGWNEIDAVGLVDEAGVTQWARRVTASSTYANSSGRAGIAQSTLLPAWARSVDQPSPAFQRAEVNRDERIVDARGWPLLALSSAVDAGSTASSSPPQISGLVNLNRSFVITTPGQSGSRVIFPTRPIWIGLLGNTVVYAIGLFILWVILTIPRRFVRDLARLRRGACVGCGYDLGFDFIHGCPECGWRRTGGEARP